MYGYKIDLLMDTQENNNSVNDDIRDYVPHLIWSSYDRINAQKSTKFEEFFNLDDCTAKWTGSIQTLHLFSTQFKNQNTILIRENDAIYNDLFYAYNFDKEFPLGMIISLKINEEVFCPYDMNKNKKIVDVIENIIKTEYANCPAECFFSLGEEDIVLIALGDSVDKFMELLESIRNLYFVCNNEKKSLCNMSNSFLIQNCKQYTGKIECSNSIANLYIALKNGINDKKFLSDFINENFREEQKQHIKDQKTSISTIMIGEYDIVLNLKNNYFKDSLFSLYSENSNNNSLNAKSDFYKSNIKNSKTIWSYNMPDDVYSRDGISQNKTLYECQFDETYTSKHNDDFCKEVDTQVKKLIEELNDKVKNNKEKQYAYYNVIYFLKDSSLTLHSTNNKQWKYIISNQINAFISLYEYYSKCFENTDHFDNFIQNVNELINDMRSSFDHINRSHELFYHIPTSSLHYSGSFNAILLAYYNFINALLNVAFKKPHNDTKQANIVFFIYFGMTSKIQEKTYFTDYNSTDTLKLVGFELPYTALYDLKKYFISLTHEVYHLIAPYCRNRRNTMVEILWKDVFVKEKFLEDVPKYFLGSDNMSNNYKILCVKINDFFNSIILNELFDIDHFSSISIKKLNKVILDKIADGSMVDILKKLFTDFCEYCNNDDSKKFKSVKRIVNAKIKSFNSPFDNTIFDNEQINRMRILIENLPESICDTFMYQLSFERNNAPAVHYLEYMKDFFEERKINLKKNLFAGVRLALFIYYNELYSVDTGVSINIDGISEDYKETLQQCFSFVWEYFDENSLSLIFDIINEDNLIFTSRECYDKQKFNEIINEEEQIKRNYILPLFENDSFDTYIDIIYSLNKDFYLPHYEKSDSINNYPKLSYCGDLILMPDNPYPIPTYYAQTLDKYLEIVHKITLDNGKDEIWYRGICNYNYKLIPSLFVQINLLKDKHLIPYLLQIELIRQCYNETKKYYKTFLFNETTKAARQSLMQHYGMPTNLLDFSTDPLAALYWALNPDNEDDVKKYTTAVVYFFNPRKYSDACNYLKEKNNCFEHNEYSEYKKIAGGIYSHDCLSDEYIVRDTTDKTINYKLEQFFHDINDKMDTVSNTFKKLPAPVVIPQQNDRINAQSGTFVAFNLLSIPKDGDYNYNALEALQEEFIKMKQKNKEMFENEIFLERVLINPTHKNMIVEKMDKTFKYSRSSVYPDLENLFKDAKSKVLNKYKTES